MELLYSTYPELKEFGFRANGVSYRTEESYEIYPKNHIYTPFQELLKGDIKSIWKRNFNYASSYNSGEYTVSKVVERLDSKEAKHYFEVISSLDLTKLTALKKYTERETA